MVYFGIAGRLGNWMFMYANALSYGHGKAKGYIVEEWSRKFKEQYWEMFPDLEIVNELPDDVVVYEEKRFGYDQIPRFDAPNILLKGYFQSEKYFDEKRVRELYRISSERDLYLRSRYGDWLDRPNVTGVSVRRGDYFVNLENFPFVGEKYLVDCINRIDECRDFIVCSDDIPWCRRFFSRRFPDRQFLFVEGESSVNQLYLHSLCRNNIVSNSSFSWWGAWLNANPTKRVLAPTMWFGFESSRKHIDWTDIYFRGMEIVENHYGIYMYLYAHLYLWQKNLKKKVREWRGN